MYTVSFLLFVIIYITVWVTLLCVLFDFYWIHIKICGESVPSRPDRTEKIYKEPGGPYQIGKVLRALFSPRKVYSRGLHGTANDIKKGCEQMAKRSVHYVRGPPEWIRTDSLSGSKTEKVNQIWFTPTPCPNAPSVGQMPSIGHGRETAETTSFRRVCGAVERHSRTT